MNITRTKRTYFAVLALNWLAVGLTLPISVLFMQARGLDLAQVGLVMALYAATVALLELPTGGLADSIGRKRVALLSNTISLLSVAALLFAFSFWWILPGMILLGISRALSSGALDAWYVDSLQAGDPAVDLQAALAQANTITLVALGAGTLAGGALPTLFSNLPPATDAVLSPLSTPFIVSLFFKIVLLLLIALAVVEPPRAGGQAANWRDGVRAVPYIVRDSIALTVHNRFLPYLLGAALVGGFTLSGVEAFWQPDFARRLGDVTGQSWLFGLVMALSFLAGIGGNLLSIPLSKRVRNNYALLAAGAVALQAAALFVMAVMLPAAGFVGGFWAFYLSNGLVTSPHETLVNREIPAQRRSAMLSVHSLATYAGGFLGSIILGAFAETQGISTAWFVAAAVAVVSFLLYVRIARQKTHTTSGYEQRAPIPDSSTKANAG